MTAASDFPALEDLPGLSEEALVRLGPCIVCDKPLFDRDHAGVTFYRVAVSRCMVEAGYIRFDETTLDEADIDALRQIAAVTMAQWHQPFAFLTAWSGPRIDRLRAFGLVQTGTHKTTIDWPACGPAPSETRHQRADIVRLTPAGRACLAALPSPFARADDARREAERLLQRFDQRVAMRRDVE